MLNINRFCYLLLIISAIGSVFLPHPLATWLLFLNLQTLMMYAADKIAACKSWRRLPEKTLLFFGLIGGWPGALLGQQLFRHKTQKQPFKTYLYLSVVVNIAVLVGIYRVYFF